MDINGDGQINSILAQHFSNVGMRHFFSSSLKSALCLCQSCDVLDIDPTGNYSETTAFNSIKNLDLYVKGFRAATSSGFNPFPYFFKS